MHQNDGEQTTNKGGVQRFGSVFAAAEDYAEAIDSADVEQDLLDLEERQRNAKI